MKKYAILVYGLVCYAIFFATFLYAIWFVFNMDATPSHITLPLSERLFIDAGLLTLFALQHSLKNWRAMMRAKFRGYRSRPL